MVRKAKAGSGAAREEVFAVTHRRETSSLIWGRAIGLKTEDRRHSDSSSPFAPMNPGGTPCHSLHREQALRHLVQCLLSPEPSSWVILWSGVSLEREADSQRRDREPQEERRWEDKETRGLYVFEGGNRGTDLQNHRCSFSCCAAKICMKLIPCSEAQSPSLPPLSLLLSLPSHPSGP